MLIIFNRQIKLIIFCITQNIQQIRQMDKFITQYVMPLLQKPLNEQQKKQKLAILQTDLKIFTTNLVKTQSSSLNKQLAKKSRQLFILSSDNETLKQTINQLTLAIQSTKNQVNALQQQKAKQKILTQREILQLNKSIENLQKQMKKQIARLKMEKQVAEDGFQVKISQIKNQHTLELNAAIDQEKRIQDEIVQGLKNQFEDQKNQILKQSSQKKREIIQKYQQKIQKICSEYQDKLFLINKQFSTFKSESKSSKASLQSKIASLQNTITVLTSNLSKQTQSHKKYNQLYTQISSQLSNLHEQSIKQKQSLQQKLHESKLQYMELGKKYTKDVKQLENTLAKTIQEKDMRYTEKVEQLETEFRVEIQSLETRLVQEREIAISQVEIRRDQENYDHEKRYQALKEDFEELKGRYDRVQGEFKREIGKLKIENQEFVQGLNRRKQYQLQVLDKNAQRQFTSLKNKYQLQISSIYSQHETNLSELASQHSSQKQSLTNKLTTQYQSMLSDQKSSHEIQIKQKLIEFDRKVKNYQSKIKEGEKKRNQLKVAMERMKMEMQMRVESMVELNQVYQGEIANLGQRVQNTEREKEKIGNQYELKILMLRNEMKSLKEEYEQRESELKELLESKLRTRNQEVTKILARVKKENQSLIESHEKRVQAMEKQYNQLKRVVGQKTSLPEDIEALKIFHDAYLQKEKQVQTEKQKVQFLYRQLRSKDAIDKVFAEKGSKKIHMNYNSVLPQPTTLLTFKSQQM